MNLMLSWKAIMIHIWSEILMMKNQLQGVYLALDLGLWLGVVRKNQLFLCHPQKLSKNIYVVLRGLRIILEDVGEVKKHPTIIKCDNQSTIKLANNLVYHAISKHI